MPKGTCTSGECDRAADCRGLCNMHYRRARKAGLIQRVNLPQVGPCSVADCDAPAERRGLCRVHSARWYRTGSVETTRQRRTCTIGDCDLYVLGHGLCSKHYYRLKRHGDVSYQTKAEPGTGSIRDNGYRVVRAPGHPLAGRDGAALEHRLVLYAKIGPGSHPCHWCGTAVSWMVDLTADHLDWDRLNNVAENLVPSCQSCNSGRSKNHRRGSEAPSAKLTEADVLAIRASADRNVDLARRYGITPHYVYQIRRGTTWRHLLEGT